MQEQYCGKCDLSSATASDQGDSDKDDSVGPSSTNELVYSPSSAKKAQVAGVLESSATDPILKILVPELYGLISQRSTGMIVA